MLTTSIVGSSGGLSRWVHDRVKITCSSQIINLKVPAFHKFVHGIVLHKMTDNLDVVVSIGSGVFMPEANSMTNQMHHYSSAVTILSKFDHLLAAIVAYKFGVATRIIPTGTGASVSIGRSELYLYS